MDDFPYLAKFEQIVVDSKLSPVSKSVYIARLRRLVKMTGKDVNWIMKNADDTMKMLVEDHKVTELQSKKAYINSVLTLFKHTNELKQKLPNSYATWLQRFREVNSEAQLKYDTCQASQRQKDAYVTWDEVTRMRDSLDKSSLDYLVTCLYSMIPPSRADMNEVKIHVDHIPTDAEEEEFPNYLLIESGENKMTLVYNEFKSKSKRMQKYENELPEELVDVVETSLKADPREFLIVSPKTKKPYHNPHSYTVFVDRMLSRLFKKNVTINTLRHSFINSVDMNVLTPLEKKALSSKLMHSPSTFDRYRFV